MTYKGKRDLEYEKNNKIWDSINEYETIKCKNFELCRGKIWEGIDCYLCLNCDIMYGTWKSIHGPKKTGKGYLNFKDDIECPICFETKRGVDQANCEHYLCIQCFRNIYYKDFIEEPEYPYPDLNEEDYDDEKNPGWRNEYPLLKKFYEELDKYDEEMEKANEHENLNICPLCRK